MAEIVNLRQKRKQVQRKVAEDKAAANRAQHGTPKPLRRQREAEAALERKRLEDHKRQP